jgi:hypothetical protein
MFLQPFGRSPWFYRMADMTATVMRYAAVKSDFGNLPDTGAELNGDVLQSQVRLAPMTGDRRYLEWAERIADAYVREVLPRNHWLPGYTWDFAAHTGPDRMNLRDHGNEMVVHLGRLTGSAGELRACAEITSHFAGGNISFCTCCSPALRGAAAGGHPRRWLSSTMCTDIACVAPPRACPPQERCRRDGARARMRTYFCANPLPRPRRAGTTGGGSSARLPRTRGGHARPASGARNAAENPVQQFQNRAKIARGVFRECAHGTA